MSVLATSVPVTDGGKKVVIRVLCIHYPVWFQENQEQENQEQVKTLLDSGSEFNVINPAFARKLGFYIQKTNVRAQKIDGSILKTFGIVIADFQVEDKGGRPSFFQKIFLRANIKSEMIFKMLFLKISNIDVAFGERTLMWKSYITNKALPITKQVWLVNLK